MSEEETNALVNIGTQEKTILSDFSIDDSQLSKQKLFKEIEDFDELGTQAPVDPIPDIFYERMYSTKCQLCKAPENVRNRIEHEWIYEGGKSTHAVVTFVSKYYNARLTWQCIHTHMEKHCLLQDVPLDAFGPIERMPVHIDQRVIGREDEVARKIIMDQIQTLHNMKTNKNPELALKKAARMESLADKLNKMKEYRDKIPMNGINVFNILFELLGKMKYEDDKKIIVEFVHDLRERINKMES